MMQMTKGIPFVGKSTGMDFVRSLRSLPAQALVVIVLLTTGACSDAGDSTVQAPTLTPVSGDTAALSTSEKVSFSGTGEHLLNIDEYGETPVDLKAGDLLRISFTVTATTGENPSNPTGFTLPGAGIILTVLDPLGNQMMVRGEGTGQTEAFILEVEDTVELVTRLDGEHLIGFFNPFKLRFLIVKYEYSVNPQAEASSSFETIEPKR